MYKEVKEEDGDYISMSNESSAEEELKQAIAILENNTYFVFRDMEEFKRVISKAYDKIKELRESRDRVSKRYKDLQAVIKRI